MRELVRGNQKVLLCLVRVPFWCLPLVLLLVTGCASTKRFFHPIHPINPAVNQAPAGETVELRGGSLTQEVGTAKLEGSISRSSH
jgi:hypothetical protein